MMRVEQVPSGGETLRDLVDSIIDLGADRHFLLALMAQAGINPADLEQCGSVSFRVIEQRIYEVDDGFPRITSASFVGGALPAGVIRLAYQIDLSGEPPFPLDEAAVSAVYAEFSRGTTA